ncbi:MAG: hypothetical protein AAFR17_14435 [Pseudomonadota bacterium]
MMSFWRFLSMPLAALLSVATAQAEPVTLPGTSITIEVPEGFEVAREFSGLQNPETSASFLIATLPAEAEPQLSALFETMEMARTAFSARGIDITGEIDLEEEATPHPAYSGVQQAQGVEFTKWLALYTGEEVLLVTYQSPPEVADPPETIEAVFNSIRFGAALSLEEQLAALPYRVTDLGGMRITGTSAGSAVSMTIGEADIDPESKQPFLFIAPSLGNAFVETPDPLTESARLLGSISTVEIGEVESEADVSVAGWPGKRLEATAVDRDSRRDLRVVQWVGFSERSYIRIIGLAPADLWDEALPAFEAVAAGVAWRQ